MEVIADVFGGITLPGKMITKSGMVWRPGQVSCRAIDEEIQFPKELQEVAEQILDIKGARNDPTFHFRSAWARPESLTIEVGRSRYKYNLLHAAFEEKMRHDHPEILEALLGNIQREDLFDLHTLGGPLSSGVGITTVAVLADGSTVMTHRSKKVAVNADIDHTALAKRATVEDVSHGKIDLAAVAIRSGVEELNLPIRREGVVVLGMCVDGRYWWPGIIAVAKIPLFRQEVLERAREAPDSWERLGDVRFIPYTPKGLAEQLLHAMKPGKGVTGFGSMALLEAGIADFGRKEMEAAFRSI